MPNNDDNYLSIGYFQNSLGLTRDDVDDRHMSIVSDANAEVRKALLPFADKVVEGTDTWRQAVQIALTYAKYRWLTDVGQESRARLLYEDYAEKKAAIVQTLRADRTERTKAVLVTSDPRDRRLLLPALRNTFVLDFY